MKVPLVDLRAQYQGLRDAARAAIDRVCDQQAFILGEEVAVFENALAEFVGVEHAIGVSSGSDALLCALLALGVGPGHEVITTPFTFFATAGSIVRAGATPRFVDVCANTLNLDASKLEATLTSRARAILPVHLFGNPAEMDAICACAERHGLAVVEDAAQALGARYRGRPCGAWGAFGAFSFFPSKPLGGFGDGGMVVTRDRALAERCRELRAHGANSLREHRLVGGNFRLDALQAAILQVKLPYLERWLAAREAHARAYDAVFTELPGLALLSRSPNSHSANAHYTLRVREGRRDRLAAHLLERDVQTAIYYARPLHLQPCFAELGLRQGAFPESERAAAEVLSIPLYAELSTEQRDYVSATIVDFFK